MSDIVEQGKRLAEEQRSVRYAQASRQRAREKALDSQQAVIIGYNAELGKVLLKAKGDKLVACTPMTTRQLLPGKKAMYQSSSKTADYL